jgi:hypothetical protein
LGFPALGHLGSCLITHGLLR